MFGISPFHLLWMLPAAYIFGMLSLAFPFSIVSYIGTPFGKLCCLGLSQAAVERNQRRFKLFEELRAQGMSAEDVWRQMEHDSS